MIRHDRTRQELPAPVAGCLLELTTDHLGLSAGQPDRITGQLVLGDATEVRPAFVVGAARLVIPPLGSVALELRADEAALVTGQPGPVRRPGQEPDAIDPVPVHQVPPGERGASAPCL